MKTRLRIFQTGRYYGPGNQVILAKVVEVLDDQTIVVDFHDLTRRISGRITVSEFTELNIIASYDEGGYEQIRSFETSMAGVLVTGEL